MVKKAGLDWHPVDSSNLARVAWDRETLYIEFHHGGQYSYTGVSESVFNKLRNASSPGQYFDANIKNQYPTSKL
jgi:hypothetical protein